MTFELVTPEWGKAKLAWPDAAVWIESEAGWLRSYGMPGRVPVDRLPLRDQLCGLALTPDRETLLVMDLTSVAAYDRDLKPLWTAVVAVDGVLLQELTDERATFECELDPPGGWVSVELDVRTGTQV